MSRPKEQKLHAAFGAGPPLDVPAHGGKAGCGRATSPLQPLHGPNQPNRRLVVRCSGEYPRRSWAQTERPNQRPHPIQSRNFSCFVAAPGGCGEKVCSLFASERDASKSPEFAAAKPGRRVCRRSTSHFSGPTRDPGRGEPTSEFRPFLQLPSKMLVTPGDPYGSYPDFHSRAVQRPAHYAQDQQQMAEFLDWSRCRRIGIRHPGVALGQHLGIDSAMSCRLASAPRRR